ncbi:MAG: hypothetical protein JXQ90_09960 [Cyclobacteriaceae bacterium]
MMNRLVFTSTIVLLFTACQQSTSEKQAATQEIVSEKPTVTLKEVWSSDTTLRTPECVIYDKPNDVLYVSNINENPWEKDGNGFISRLSTNGEVLELKWVEGLHGPKGMALKDNSLFVNDMDELVEINTSTGEIINRTVVTDENCRLNDATIGDDGTLYISGSGNQTVYQVKDGTIDTLISGDLGRPNGLLALGNQLLILGNVDTTIKSLNLKTMELKQVHEGIARGDGIVPTGKGGYIVTNWLGEIHHVTADWKSTKLLDSKAQNIYTADIDYIKELDLLLVPTFFDNRVVAYSLFK